MCNHKTPVRLDDDGKAEYLCVRCGERWTAGRNGNIKQAPEGWQEMSQKELAVWYAKNVMGADLSGHGRNR